jgi:hypothetical protein
MTLIRRPVALLLASLVVILMAAMSPILVKLAARWIAGAHGCILSEAAAHPCVVLGREVGGLLSSMAMLVWYATVTLPFGVFALGVWLIVAFMLLIRHLRGGARVV